MCRIERDGMNKCERKCDRSMRDVIVSFCVLSFSYLVSFNDNDTITRTAGVGIGFVGRFEQVVIIVHHGSSA